MANVTDDVANIRGSILGIDVRESIAEGIEDINAEVVSTTARQLVVEGEQTIANANEIIRQSAESGRVAAETLRESTTDAIKSAYDLATKANLSVEVSNARGTYDTLQAREDATTASITLNTLEIGLKAPQTALDTTNANIANIQINASAYGAKFDNTTDDTLAIQTAINYLQSIGGGTLICPTGTSLISAKITINKPIYIKGKGWGSDTSNTNGSGTGITTFKWSGVTNDTMFEFKSSIANNYLFGGGVKGCLLNGNNIANIGIRGSSIGYMNFDVEVRNVIQEGILFDAGNGVLTQFNTIENYHFVYGSSDLTMNAHGLVMDDSVGGQVTQNHIISITGLTKNGHLIKIGWSDNNVIEKALGNAIGTGVTLYLANSGTLCANNNVIKYMAGKVHAESLTSGNRILHLISEGSGIVVDAGGILHYDVMDYTKAQLFSTLKYIMSDKKDLPLGVFQIRDGASNGTLASQWPCINFADGIYGTVGTMLPPPSNWGTGTLTSLRLYFSTDIAQVSQNWLCNVNVSTYGTLAGTTTPQKTVAQTIAVNNSAYINTVVDIPLGLAYAMDDSIFIQIQRAGADALDTTTAVVQFLGASLNYTSSGATSGGSGTYAVTPTYK